MHRGARVLGSKRVCGGGRICPGKHIQLKGTEAQKAALFDSVAVGDIGPDTDWTPALVGVDAVVHLAARVHTTQETAADPLAEFRKVNVDGTRRLAEAAAQEGVKRFVFLSSVKVNGETTERGGRPLIEEDLPQPEEAYGISKWEAEQVLRKIEQRTGMEVVIIRPPLIYGPAVKANFLRLIQVIERGMPLPFGGIRNQRSLLSLTNLVDLICCCRQHPAAAGETFLASDGDDVSTPELARRIAQALGKPLRLLRISEWIMKLGGTITGKSEQVKRLCSSLQIDSSKARQVLGWTPPCTMAEELVRVAQWRATCLNTKLRLRL